MKNGGSKNFKIFRLTKSVSSMFLFEILSKISIKDELSIKTQEAAEAQGEFWDEEAWFILRGHSLFNQTTRLQLMRAILTCELSFESHRAKIFGYNFARPACEDDRDISLLACYLSILEEERECNDGADEEAVVEESVDDHCRS